jgi:hypothetical protein
MLTSYSKISNVLRGPSRIHIVLAAVFLPWLVTVFCTAGIWAELNLLGYALAAFLAGYALLSLAVPGSARTKAIMFSPALGIMVFSSLTAQWLRLGFSLRWVPALWLMFVVVGMFRLWRDRAEWLAAEMAYGSMLTFMSVLICLIYFLPAARNDAVLRHDGTFHWMYVDTQYSYAIAAAIKGGESPPVGPGTTLEQLRYHFGPYAPAALISHVTNLDLGDALARVTRGTSLWALVLSSFGLGTLLSVKATGRSFGGIVSVAGLFFYGSLLSLFTDEANGASHVRGAIVFKLPDVAVLSDGGPFSHLILGHSMLHGLGAITAIMGLCLVQMEKETPEKWRAFILLTLPAVTIPVNSVAALYSLGVTIILIFWKRLNTLRSLVGLLFTFGLFLVVWKIMGLSQAPDATEVALKSHIVSQWWTLVVGFIVGLGFRITGFRWISRPLSDPMSALVLITVLGLLAFSLVPQLPDGNERYGIYYLQCLFSILAFSRVSPGAWDDINRVRWTTEWLRLATKGMVILSIAGIAIGFWAYVSHSHTGTPHFAWKLILALLLLSLLATASALMNRSPRFAAGGSTVLLYVLLIGFLAWITPWLNFGLERMRMEITISAGEVQGLDRLGGLAAPDQMFATNEHALDALASRQERSYAYSALSERPVLLEGYLYRGITGLAWFPSLLHNNDLMFSTTDPAALRGVANTYHVRWLVARPGTDISLPRPLPAWLIEEKNCGSLKIYQVN